MGFLQLIPASQLTATYDGETRTLLLRAQGQSQNATTGIHLVPLVGASGAFVFQLRGWVGPVTPGTSTYDHRQRFDNFEFPGSFVQIADAGHPHGYIVPVQVDPGASARAATPIREVRHIAVGGPLELRAGVWEQRGATQLLDHDASFVSLEAAAIQNPTSGAEIVWNLRGQRPGETEVTITSIGGLAPIKTTRVVQVVISAVPGRRDRGPSPAP